MSETPGFVCTKADPYTVEKAKAFGGFAMHPDAVFVNTTEDWFEGDETDNYHCPNCGIYYGEYIPR